MGVKGRGTRRGAVGWDWVGGVGTGWGGDAMVDVDESPKESHGRNEKGA